MKRVERGSASTSWTRVAKASVERGEENSFVEHGRGTGLGKAELSGKERVPILPGVRSSIFAVGLSRKEDAGGSWSLNNAPEMGIKIFLRTESSRQVSSLLQ